MLKMYSTVSEELMGSFGLKKGLLWNMLSNARRILETLVSKNGIAKRIINSLDIPSLLGRPQNRYQKWVALNDVLRDTDRNIIYEHIQTLAYCPTITIIAIFIPNKIEFYRQFLKSITSQIYRYYHLYVICDTSKQYMISNCVDIFFPNIDIVRLSCFTNMDELGNCLNLAIRNAKTDYVCILDPTGILPDHALYMAAVHLNKEQGCAMLYADEDMIDDHHVRRDPFFKPEWSPDLFYSRNYLGHFVLYRTDLLRETVDFSFESVDALRYALALRVLEKATQDQIGHVPHILFHKFITSASDSVTNDETDEGNKFSRVLLQNHFQKLGINGQVTWGCDRNSPRVCYPLPDEAPLVSVVVPTNGVNLKCLSKCIEGVLKKTDYPRIELVVVANNVKSEEANRYFHILSANQCTKVLWYPDSFNFSDIYNFAVSQSRAEVICAMNDDVIVISAGWLKEMVSHALRPEIGAVGAMLYYPDETIQHAGVVLGLGGVAGHVSRSLPRGSRGYQDRARLVQNFSAVTAACMVMRRSVFEEVGGFDVNLAVAYNDVDLCLRVREAGYRILWTPYAEMYHMERVSRGSDHASENLRRYMKEKEYMLLKWGDALASDPYYNPNLSLLGGNFEVSFSPRLNSKPWLLRKVQ